MCLKLKLLVQNVRSRLVLGAAGDDNDDETLASVYSEQEPYAYFQMQQTPTATWDISIPLASSASRLDHVVDCAGHGECDVEEMTSMIDGKSCS